MRPALRRVVVPLCLCLSATSLAADPAPKPGATKKKPAVKVPSFSLPDMGEVPRADGLQRPKAEVAPAEPSTVRPQDATYSVVKVEFAKAFVRGPQGHAPVQPFTSVALRGKPPTTEKFSSLVRVRSPQRVNASIEMAVLDPRGDTAMTSSGELAFRGTTTDEIDYLVDWDPTPCRSAGKFHVLVRVAGVPMGSWPLLVEEKP